jgi:hypothetical protein
MWFTGSESGLEMESVLCINLIGITIQELAGPDGHLAIYCNKFEL